MTRINAIRNAETRSSTAWGSIAWTKRFATGAMGNINAYVFAAVLIICSVAVGCSSDKPKPVTKNQTPATQPQATMPAPMPAPVAQAENKPAPRKVVRKRPATVNYADKTYGVTFEYPRRYAIETGDAAQQLVASNPLPMNFVQPGGIALAAVELPETGYTNTDFSSAYFNVSVHKALNADQCSEFAVPQQKSEAKPASNDAAKDASKSDSTQTTASADQASTAKSSDSAMNSKLLVGDMELLGTEAVSGEGTRQSDSKFFHVYQNGACYEFALNVTTDASDEGLVKHVDRDRVFNRLGQILATVKINPLTPEVATDSPAPAVPATPAQ